MTILSLPRGHYVTVSSDSREGVLGCGVSRAALFFHHSPEALGTLNKVIKGGFSKEVPSDLKDKGAGPGRTRGMKSGDGVTQGSIGPK